MKKHLLDDDARDLAAMMLTTDLSTNKIVPPGSMIHTRPTLTRNPDGSSVTVKYPHQGFGGRRGAYRVSLVDHGRSLKVVHSDGRGYTRVETTPLSSIFVAQEMKTRKYPRKQAVAIGLSRSRAAARETARKSKIAEIASRYR